MNLFNRLFKRSEKEHVKDGPIQKFEKEIQTWDYEQARIAVACLGVVLNGDNSAIKQLFGQHATLELAIGYLKVGHMRFLHEIIREIENTPSES